MTSIPSTAGGHEIMIADPAWNFSGNSVLRPGKNARRHYPCMSLDAICALPVKENAAPDALLLMWVTAPFAEMAFRVVKAWGFTYKSQLVWPKQRIATGYWARGRHELVYIARRGKFPCLRPALFPDSIIPGAQGVHSRKPMWLHDVIDARFPEARKLELFARAERPGWAAFGNEVDRFNA